jgi:predicted NAD/FAD-dependent oxidoreductase
MAKIAIIGAGLAGLVIARELHPQHDVTVFEKARGVGGRMSTRYADTFRFDHGAQFFTARSRAFKAFLQPLVDANLVAPWHARFAEIVGPTITQQRQWGDDFPHYVGVPGMNAIQKHLAEGLTVKTSTEVKRCDRINGEWRLQLADTTSVQTDWLIVTAPLPQTRQLLGSLVDVSWSQPMKACYAMMLGFAEDFPTDFDAARVLDADISWVSRNNTKPGRSAEPTVVVHATNAWADEHVDVDIDTVQMHLTAELKRTTGIDATKAEFKTTHRWRFANIDKQSGPTCILDADQKLGVCADWLIRGRVESAFRSARDLLDKLKEIRLS